MVIRFKQDCTFSVVESYDEDTDTTQERDETFKADYEVEGDIVNEEGDYVSFQFGHGEMIYGLRKELFEVVKED